MDWFPSGGNVKATRRTLFHSVVLLPAVMLARRALAFGFWGDDDDSDDTPDGLDGEVAYMGDEVPETPPRAGKANVKADPFDAKMKHAQEQIKERRFTLTIGYLEKLGVQKKKVNEARRLFYLARAMAGKKRYAEAIALNERALTLKPSQVTSRFNCGCYACLANDHEEALKHLKLMVDYLVGKKSKSSSRFLTMMRTDPDLTPVRKLAKFKKLEDKLAKV
jgi:tetratricopeptide (TPR) repeat protein